MRIPAPLAVLVLAAALVRADGNPVSPAPRVALAWDRFYDYGEMVDALEALRDASGGCMRMTSIGESVQGRKLWVAVLADPAGPPEEDRPAVYIDANVHGNEVQGTEVCLYTIWYLLENWERLPPVGDLLKRLTFYIAPSVNPDGRESWFHEPNSAHSPRSGFLPFDDDRDGQADEDGPDDLDGDGSITLMRKRVESGGTHRLDPEDPRRLVRARPGEEAPFLLLGEEGIDNDGDGRINEDGPGGYDMNRNFPGDWRPDWLQRGASPYPLSYPETRAVAEFVLDHPRIVVVQSYHNNGGMILRGPGNRPPPDYPPEDRLVFDELGATGERILPHYRYMALGKDLYEAHGTFVCWAFEQRGAFAFTNELWSSDQYLGREEEDHESRRAERYRWEAEMEHGRHFRPWKAFDHPQYGEIEIGGMGRAIGRVPPPFMLEELCHRNAAFTLAHAGEAPLLEIAAPETREIAPGLFRIRAEVRNRKLIPTRSAYARLRGAGLPDFFEITLVRGRVVAGGPLEGAPLLERARPQEHRPGRLRIEGGVPSRGAVHAEWIVTAPPGTDPEFTLTYVSEKGGRVVLRP